jgi:hypothetical protein
MLKEKRLHNKNRGIEIKRVFIEKSININHEESVIIHNAVIFMANDLMQEIQELEAWIAEKKDERSVAIPELKEMKKRWELMVKITGKVE